MKTYNIIGVMTGNSMDAIDLVLTRFEGKKIKDICSFSKPFLPDMQKKTADLRSKVFQKTKAEILHMPEFKAVHDNYVKSIADAIDEMCTLYHIQKKNVDAIGFHGKTLDHNPPSKALKEGTTAYTLQIGSGQMLADMTDIKVVYDFRSDFILKGFEGAPLVGPHNAHIAITEGDGIYYNGGNTSNFALIKNGETLLSSDAGPFNEYIDAFVRLNTQDSCDFNGKYGLQGKLDTSLLSALFEICRLFYEAKLPKSGDPQYYHQNDVLKLINRSEINFEDAVHTLEYFAAYIAFEALSLIDEKFDLPQNILLFGGGWKNPVVKASFEALLKGKGYVLPQHQKNFETLINRFKTKPKIKYCTFGEMMEARLMADMAYFKLLDKPWPLPEVKTIVAGKIAEPEKPESKHIFYNDMLSAAAKIG